MSNGFPLPGLLRRVAEGHEEEAGRMLKLARRDVELLLNGEPRSGVFRDETDPVENLIAAARQLMLCEVTLKMDDESKGTK